VLTNNECNIRKRIISYSTENATQKIWEGSRNAMLITLTDYQTAIAVIPLPLDLEKEKAAKEKNLNRLGIACYQKFI